MAEIVEIQEFCDDVFVAGSYEDVKTVIAKSAKSGRPLVIKYYAPWCKPCEMIAPWFKEFAADNSGVADFATMNIDLDDEVVSNYGLKTIPAFHIWSDGLCVGRFGREQEKIAAALGALGSPGSPDSPESGSNKRAKLEIS